MKATNRLLKKAGKILQRFCKHQGRRIISSILVFFFSATMTGLPNAARAISANEYKNLLSTGFQLPTTGGQTAGTNAEDAFTAIPGSTTLGDSVHFSATDTNVRKTESMTVGDFRVANLETYAGSLGTLDTSALSGSGLTTLQTGSGSGDQTWQGVLQKSGWTQYNGIGEITQVAALSGTGTGLPATTATLGIYEAGQIAGQNLVTQGSGSGTPQTQQQQTETSTVPVGTDPGTTTIQQGAAQTQESQTAASGTGNKNVLKLGTGLQTEVYPIGQRPINGKYNAENALHRQGSTQEASVVGSFTSTKQYVKPSEREAQFSERITAVNTWVESQHKKVEETREKIESGQQVDLRTIFRGSSTEDTQVQKATVPVASGTKTIEQRLAEVEQKLGITSEPGATLESRISAIEAKGNQAQTGSTDVTTLAQGSAPVQDQTKEGVQAKDATINPATGVATTTDFNIVTTLFSSGNDNGLKMSETVGKTASALSTPNVAVKDRATYIDQAKTPTLKIMSGLTQGTTDYQNANVAMAYNRLAAYIVADDADRESIKAEIDVYVTASGNAELKAFADKIINSQVALGASDEAVRNDQAKLLLSAYPGEPTTDIYATAGEAKTTETATTGAESVHATDGTGTEAMQAKDQTTTHESAVPATSTEKPVLNAADIGNQVLNAIDLDHRTAFTGAVGNIRTAMESTTAPEARFNMITAAIITPNDAMKTAFTDQKSAAAANRMMVYYKAAQYVALSALDQDTCTRITIPDKAAALAEIKTSMQDLAGAVGDPDLDNFVNYITDDSKTTEQDQLDKVNLVRTSLGQAEAATDSSVTSPELPETFIDNSLNDNKIDISSANIGKGGQIGTHVAIGAGTTIGDKVSIYANTHIGQNVKIGNDVIIEGGSWIEDGVELPAGAHVVGLITKADVDSQAFKDAVAAGTIYGKKETVSDAQLKELGLATRADVAAASAPVVEEAAPEVKEAAPEVKEAAPEVKEAAPEVKEAKPKQQQQQKVVLDTTARDDQIKTALQADTPDVAALKSEYSSFAGTSDPKDAQAMNMMLKYQAAIYVLDPSSQADMKTKMDFNLANNLPDPASRDQNIMAAITLDGDGKVVSVDKTKLMAALGITDTNTQTVSVAPGTIGVTDQLAATDQQETSMSTEEKMAAIPASAGIRTAGGSWLSGSSGAIYNDPALFKDGALNEEIASDPLKKTEYRDNTLVYDEILNPTRMTSPYAGDKTWALQYVIANGVNPLATASTYTCDNGKTITLGTIITKKDGNLDTVSVPGWGGPADNFLTQSADRDAKAATIFGSGWHAHVGDEKNIALAVEYYLENNLEIPAEHKSDIPEALKTKYSDYKYKDTLYTATEITSDDIVYPTF